MYLKSPYTKRLDPKQMKRFFDYLGIQRNKNNSSAVVLVEELGQAFLDKGKENPHGGQLSGNMPNSKYLIIKDQRWRNELYSRSITGTTYVK